MKPLGTLRAQSVTKCIAVPGFLLLVASYLSPRQKDMLLGAQSTTHSSQGGVVSVKALLRIEQDAQTRVIKVYRDNGKTPILTEMPTTILGPIFTHRRARWQRTADGVPSFTPPQQMGSFGNSNSSTAVTLYAMAKTITIVRFPQQSSSKRDSKSSGRLLTTCSTKHGPL